MRRRPHHELEGGGECRCCSSCFMFLCFCVSVFLCFCRQSTYRLKVVPLVPFGSFWFLLVPFGSFGNFFGFKNVLCRYCHGLPHALRLVVCYVGLEAQMCPTHVATATQRGKGQQWFVKFFGAGVSGRHFRSDLVHGVSVMIVPCFSSFYQYCCPIPTYR
jgi:hypothetical protein